MSNYTAAVLGDLVGSFFCIGLVSFVIRRSKKIGRHAFLITFIATSALSVWGASRPERPLFNDEVFEGWALYGLSSLAWWGIWSWQDRRIRKKAEMISAPKP